MDPGIIESTAELVKSVLRTGYRIHAKLFGEKSVDRLKQLNEDLQSLNDFLERIVHDAKLPGAGQLEPFKGFNSLETTLEDCKKFFKQYEAALEQPAGTYSAAQSGRLNEGKLETYHKKISQHYLELHQWSSRVFARNIANWRSM
jgi:hypothetical protein